MQFCYSSTLAFKKMLEFREQYQFNQYTDNPFSKIYQTTNVRNFSKLTIFNYFYSYQNLLKIIYTHHFSSTI